MQDNIRTTAEDHFQDVRLISFKSENLHWQPGDVLIVRPENSDEQVNEFFAICQEHGFDFGTDSIVSITEIDAGKKKKRLNLLLIFVFNLFFFLFKFPIVKFN